MSWTIKSEVTTDYFRRLQDEATFFLGDVRSRVYGGVAAGQKVEGAWRLGA